MNLVFRCPVFGWFTFLKKIYILQKTNIFYICLACILSLTDWTTFIVKTLLAQHELPLLELTEFVVEIQVW